VNVERINENENTDKFKDESSKIYFFDSTNNSDISEKDKSSKILNKFYTYALWITGL